MPYHADLSASPTTPSQTWKGSDVVNNKNSTKAERKGNQRNRWCHWPGLVFMIITTNIRVKQFPAGSDTSSGLSLDWCQWNHHPPSPSSSTSARDVLSAFSHFLKPLWLCPADLNHIKRFPIKSWPCDDTKRIVHTCDYLVRYWNRCGFSGRVAIKYKQVLNNRGQWLWLSWQSGRFQLQMSAVRIQLSAKTFIEHLLSTVLKKMKIKK